MLVVDLSVKFTHGIKFEFVKIGKNRNANFQEAFIKRTISLNKTNPFKMSSYESKIS